MRRCLRSAGPFVAATLIALGASACCATSSAGRCLRARTIRDTARQGDVPQLRRWLADDRSWVRETAALAAGAAGQRAVFDDVQARLLDERERPWVRSAAARALGAFGAGVDAETLASVALRPGTPPEVKVALIETICRVDPKGGPARLASLTNDADVLVAAVAQRKAKSRCAP